MKFEEYITNIEKNKKINKILDINLLIALSIIFLSPFVGMLLGIKFAIITFLLGIGYLGLLPICILFMSNNVDISEIDKDSFKEYIKITAHKIDKETKNTEN